MNNITYINVQQKGNAMNLYSSSVRNSDIDSIICWGKRLAIVDGSSSISNISAWSEIDFA